MKLFFILVNLTFIFLITDFSASVFYSYIVGTYETSETLSISDPGNKKSISQKNIALSGYAPVSKRDLFKTNVSKPLPAKKITPPPPKIQLTQLKLKLKGTITGTGSDHLAVITIKNDTRQMIYAKNDIVDRAMIKSIMKGKVVLLVDGKEEILLMADRKSGASAKSNIKPPVLAKKIQIESKDSLEESVTLTWDEVAELKKKVNDLKKEIRLRSHFHKGKLDGFRMTNIKKSSILYEKLALRNGDIITGVNGKNLKTLQDAASIYNGFDLNSGDLTTDVNIKRNGKSKKIQYLIK